MAMMLFAKLFIGKLTEKTGKNGGRLPPETRSMVQVSLVSRSTAPMQSKSEHSQEKAMDYCLKDTCSGQMRMVRTKTGDHNPERATSLRLCHGFFTDQFIFRYILGHFFPRKQNLHHVYERIPSIRYQKGKLNAIRKHHFLVCRFC